MRMFFAMVLAYLIGSIPTGLVLGRLTRGIDLREYGSGNLGATNAFRVLGRKIGATVLFVDILKGLAPVVLLPDLFGMPSTPNVEVLIGVCAVVGHTLSVFVNFKGGKGVATALGVFLAIAPKVMAVIILIGGAIILVTGYVSAAAVTGAVLLPFLLYWSRSGDSVLMVGITVAIIIIVRHRSNILRLLAGRELTIWDSPPVPGDNDPIPTTGSDRE